MKVYEGERTKIGYGVSWRNYYDHSYEVFPVPLNFFARWARDLWLWLAKPRNYKENRPYLDGYDEGYKAAEAHAMHTLRKIREEVKALKEMFIAPTPKDPS